MKINKKNLLHEKENARYKCPNFIDPKIGMEILNENEVVTDEQTASFFTEIMENFGIEISKHFKKKRLDKEALKKAVSNLSFKS